MKRALFVAVFFLLVTGVSSWAQPTVQSGYSIELVASGASAADGITIAGGYVYVTDYATGALLRVPVGTVGGSFETVASGMAYTTDVAVTADGRIFVTGSGYGLVYEVTNGLWVVRGTDFETCVSIDVIDGDLFITNSTPGTITRTDPTTFATTTVLAGLEYAWAVTSDGTDAIYFLEHGRGNIWQSTTAGAQPILLATATPYGVQFIAAERRKSAKSRYPAVLYISDPQTNVIWRLERGTLSIFASNFTGKTNMPFIGPTGLALDAAGALYVGDAANLWRITPTRRHRK